MSHHPKALFKAKLTKYFNKRLSTRQYIRLNVAYRPWKGVGGSHLTAPRAQHEIHSFQNKVEHLERAFKGVSYYATQ